MFLYSPSHNIDRAQSTVPASIVAFCACAGIIIAINSSAQYNAGNDTYFHLAIARDYAAGRLVYEPLITHGAVARYPADREFLFHLQLAMLLGLGFSPAWAATVTAALAGGLLGLVLYRHSRSLMAMMCGMFASGECLFRLALPRPHTWAVLYVVLGITLLIRKRYVLVCLVNMLYTWSYSVPIVIVGVAAIYAVAHREWRGVSCVIISSMVAYVLHPHFPHNVSMTWIQGAVVMHNVVAGNPLGVGMPNELRPWPVSDFALDCWLAVLISVVASVNHAPKWLTALQAMFFVLSLRAVRFVEYAIPLCGLTADTAIAKVTPSRRLAQWLVSLAFIGAVVVPNVTFACKVVNKNSMPLYRPAAEWLAAHAEGQSIMNVEWDAYPELRYFGGNFRLVQGQDPVFLAAYDVRIDKMIQDARMGKIGIDVLADACGARFILSRQVDPILGVKRLGMRTVYADEYVVIMQRRS